MVVSESDLVLPAVYILSKSENGEMTTSDLSSALRELLKPTGDDLTILANRTDDKFSQKVRNLKSHETLERYGLAEYSPGRPSGKYRITDAGKEFVSKNADLVELLAASAFTRDEIDEAYAQALSTVDKPKKALVFDEDAVITEGGKRNATSQMYQRSHALREAAIEHYATEGGLKCAVCGFSFEDTYGELGDGYIEIHHRKPIFTYEEDEELSLSEALQGVAPVCSNCHRMLHRRRREILTLDELRDELLKRRQR